MTTLAIVTEPQALNPRERPRVFVRRGRETSSRAVLAESDRITQSSRSTLQFSGAVSTSLPAREGRDPSNAADAALDTHPFEAPKLQRGLMAAGYLEKLDTSRKRIKTRFVHGLSKQNFKEHLEAFLLDKGLTARNDYMIRFVGTEDVHSPFVHTFTTKILSDKETVRIAPSSTSASSTKGDGTTLWTHLRTTGNSAHWSCKKTSFWPLRVVLEGPSRAENVLFDEDEETRRPDARDTDSELKRNTRKNAEHINHPKRDVIDFNTPDEPPLQIECTRGTLRQRREDLEEPGSETLAVQAAPTIGAAVRQLGIAMANSIPPQVSQAVQNQLQAIRGWTSGAARRESEEAEILRLEAEERRERRRQRREARRAERDSQQTEDGRRRVRDRNRA